MSHETKGTVPGQYARPSTTRVNIKLLPHGIIQPNCVNCAKRGNKHCLLPAGDDTGGGIKGTTTPTPVPYVKMKCSSELFVLLLALLSYFAIPVHGQKRLIIHHVPVVGSVGELLHQTVTIHLRNSAAGVCYFGAGGARVAFRRIIHDTLRDMDAFGGPRSMNVQRFCETGSCSASMQASPTKCGLSVVAVPVSSLWFSDAPNLGSF